MFAMLPWRRRARFLHTTAQTHLSAAMAHRHVTRQTLGWFNAALGLRTVFDAVCGGTTMIFVAYALALGVQQESVPRLAAAAGFGCVFQMVLLLLLGRVSNRKRLVLKLGTIEPLIVMVAVIGAPLLPVGYRMWGLMAAVFIAAAFLHMTLPIQHDWLASTIPAGLRGRYLGRRFQVMNVSFIITLLTSGWIADAIGRDHAAGLALLLAGGALFGLGAVAALSRATMVRDSDTMPVRLVHVVSALKNWPFRRYVLANTLYCLPFACVIPLYQVFYQRELHMPLDRISLVLSLYVVVKVLTGRFAGRWVDQVGPRAALWWSGLGYTLFFVLMAAASQERIWMVFAAWIVAGVFDTIYAVAANAALFAVVPREGARPAFFAVNNLILLGMYAVGAILGEVLLRQVRPLALPAWNLQFSELHVMLLSSAALMLPATSAILLMVTPTRDLHRRR